MLLLLKILLITALLIWILAIIPAYQYGQLGRSLQKIDKKLDAVEEDLPPLTVVIAAHNQAPALRRHLPVILNQDYARFEVIVIDMASTDETKDVLERLELQYAYLRHTHTPSSARDISVQRLALTLGFRAAAYDWVVMTRPDCEPISPHWLTRIGETIIHPKQGIQSPLLKQPDMVLGMLASTSSVRHGSTTRWGSIGCGTPWKEAAMCSTVMLPCAPTTVTSPSARATSSRKVASQMHRG